MNDSVTPKFAKVAVVFAYLLVSSYGFFSCTERNTKDSGLEAQMDSIVEDNRQLNLFINTLAASMDSIIMQEGNILKTSDKDGMEVPTRVQVIENVSLFKELLSRQQHRITQLQDSIKLLSSSSSEKINKIVSFYKKQIEEKEAMIAKLQEELENKDFDISQLKQHITSLNNDVTNLTMKTQEQEDALKVQDKMINEGYVMMGTKKELKAAGVLSSSGIFKKKQLNVSNFNPDFFTKVDIRNFTELNINGKSPVILTQMPKNSYTLEKVSGSSYILRISDPTSFWSVSNYLVIQYN